MWINAGSVPVPVARFQQIMSQTIAALETCVANHAGEYVRLFGIDPKATAGVGNDYPATSGNSQPQAATSSQSRNTSAAKSSSNFSSSGSSSQQLRDSGAAATTVEARVQDWHGACGSRRFRTGSWQSCSSTNNESEAIDWRPVANHAGICACLALTQGEAAVLETIIQRPDGQFQPTTTSSNSSGNADAE